MLYPGLMNFSLEITKKTDLSESYPKVKDVYITMLPGNDYREVANKAVELGSNRASIQFLIFQHRSIKNQS